MLVLPMLTLVALVFTVVWFGYCKAQLRITAATSALAFAEGDVLDNSNLVLGELQAELQRRIPAVAVDLSNEQTETLSSVRLTSEGFDLLGVSIGELSVVSHAAREIVG